MRPQPTWAISVVAVALAASLVGCGQSGQSSTGKADRALRECRDRWQDVGHSVAGMDEDTNPSALAERWNTVIATVEYYKTTDTAKSCQANIESQLKAVSALRMFSEKLRPYDMTYQLGQSRAAIDLYLHSPLPEPVRGENGKLVQPPTKPAVTAAMQLLTANAERANAELEPAWQQTDSVDLSDVTARTRAMQDLDLLAQDSAHWRRCEEALQVLVAAIRTQEGQAVAPSSGPTDATTPAG